MTNAFEKLAALKGALPPGPEERAAVPPQASPPSPHSGRIVVRRERKGRAGRTVTIVQGLALQGDALQACVRELKIAMGCGASIEGQDVVLQGDLTDRVIGHLQAMGATRIVRGSS